MRWQRGRQGPPQGWGTRRGRAAARRRFPFWAGWLLLIAGAWVFHAVIGPMLSLLMDQGAAYQCRHNAYNCSDFRSPFQAQAAYLACGGSENDVHRLDDDGDGLACEGLPLLPWFSGY